MSKKTRKVATKKTEEPTQLVPTPEGIIEVPIPVEEPKHTGAPPPLPKKKDEGHGPLGEPVTKNKVY